MIIDRDIQDYIIDSEASLVEVLRRIEYNKRRLVFVVSEDGQLIGVLTDGDIRRAIISSVLSLSSMTAGMIANRSFVYATIDENFSSIQSKFSEKIEYVPIVDLRMHLCSVARPRQGPEYIKIGGTEIGKSVPVFVVAEIGNNHNGDYTSACHLVDAAKNAGANCVKFQLRDLQSIYGSRTSDDLGSEYIFDLLIRHQLSLEDMRRIFDYARSQNILPLCTPWDEESLDFLESCDLPAYKVASADITNHGLLEAICRTGKPIIASTGMSTESEIQEAVSVFKAHGSNYLLLHCNSTYPAPLKDINLSYLTRLGEIGQCFVGYSGHERDIYVSVAAVALGACVIEKHFTLDRNQEGNDHKVSLLPHEFQSMVTGIRQVEEARGSSTSRHISQGEWLNREVLAKSLVAKRDILAGQAIENLDVDVKSPGRGLQPNYRKDLVGKISTRNICKGEFFYMSDLVGEKVSPRRYTFRRPWGVPVRYHDYHKILESSSPDFVEFHLSYRDLEVDIDEIFTEKLSCGFVVHSPELFQGDHILDLCSLDDKYRQKSVKNLNHVFDITRSLKHFFADERPFVVVNVGGASFDANMTREEKETKREVLVQSFDDLNTEGLEVLPQTMPPFPWHFGGQRYHNFFVDKLDIISLCETLNVRVCLDVSHSYLACSHLHSSFSDFLNSVAQYTAHLHMADAEGVDGEGLQIGEGHVDFKLVGEILDKLAPEASFIPEIWQGHKNDGEGFWIALDRLETAWRQS